MKLFRSYCLGLGLLLLSTVAFATENVTIQVKGVSGDAEKNIQTRLIAGLRSLGKEPSNAVIKNYLANSKPSIRKALEPFAYFRAIINTRVQQQKNKFTLFVKIIPGPQLRITQLKVLIKGVGHEDPEFMYLLENFPLKKGEPLLIQQYNDAKKAFFHIAEQRGYLDAKFETNRVIVDLDNYTASVTLDFRTGPHYYFGPVRFAPSPFATRFLNRYVHFKQGQSYSTNDLLVLQDHLNSSGYFQQVQVHPEFDNTKKKQVPIVVDLLPRKAHRFTFGIGYDGSKETLRGTLGWDWRRVTSTGHRLQLLAQGSWVQSTFQMIYTIPGLNPMTDRTNIQAALFHLNLNDVDSTALQFGVAHISNWREWQRTIGLTGLIERAYENSLVKNTTNWLYPTLNFRLIHADDRLNTSNGYMLNFLFQGASKYLLSDANFLLGQFDTKYIHSFNDDKTRAILRATVGLTAIDQVRDLAPSLRFYTGGTQSIRGYAYKELGPGKVLLVGSAEIQHVIIGKWRAAAFADFGNAFNDVRDPIYGSVGVGIVRRSPIGSINLGIARQVGQGRDNIAFIFSMGPDLS